MKRAAALLIGLLALTGCGLGAGRAAKDSSGVTIQVTRNFGAQGLGRYAEGKVRPSETVMRMLQRRFAVKTRYGGGFVNEIDGLGGGRRAGRPVDWFFYVNGIEASQGAASRRIAPGDDIWWDHHDWGAAMRIPAIVGAFPEPFVSGSGGKRFPVRIDCAPESRRSCEEVRKRLDIAGVKVGGTAILGQAVGPAVLRLVVGRWTDVRADDTVRRIERGPAVSGVYARFDRAGTRLDLLEPRGNVLQTLRAGAGLVAATSVEDQQATWVITGTDDVGVAAAAATIDEDALRNHFALAIENGQGVPLPPPAVTP